MKPYLAILSARYRTLLQYRAAALAGVGTQFFWGFIRLMILYAFYAASDAPAPMEFAAVVSYVWLGQALLGLLPWNLEPEIEERILSGGVAFELVRPLDLYGLWYARTVAMRTAATSLRVLPIVVLAGCVLPFTPLATWALGPPPTFGAAATWSVALLVAIALGGAITNLVHVSLLWTLSGEGLKRLMPSLVGVFSGMIVPLPLFPDAVQPLLAALPFRGLVDVPLRIYSGHLAGAEAWMAIAASAAWALVLVAFGRALLARGCRRLVVQGG